MRVFTSAEVREMDARTAAHGVSVETLMERAGRAVADVVMEHSPRRVCVVCGGGNNGGDGYVAARLLQRDGFCVRAVSVGRKRNALCQRQFDICGTSGVEVCVADAAHTIRDMLSDADVVMDALYGIGLDGAPCGIGSAAIEAVNLQRERGATVIAVDVPSGLSGDDGRAEGAVVRADVTVTLQGWKRGLLFGRAKEVRGRVVVKDIGAQADGLGVEFCDDCTLPLRKQTSHKGDYAFVTVIGGSRDYPGAGKLAYASCRAALRSGAGLARLAVADSDFGIFAPWVVEEMLTTLPSDSGRLKFDADALDRLTARSKTVVLGSGLGDNAQVGEISTYLLTHFDGTLVLDADGLNTLNLAKLSGATCRVILTPHVKEFSRLSSVGMEDVLRDPIGCAQDFATRYGATVLLKSDVSVSTDGMRTVVTDAGTPALAKGGSGDVLAGCVAALASIVDPVSACYKASVACGQAARRAAERIGEHGVLATDYVDDLRFGAETKEEGSV